MSLVNFRGMLLFAAVVVVALGARPTVVKAADSESNVAIFAGGCFWCVESDFDKVPGVLETTSGYAGGHTDNPTYKQVSYDDTGHFEAVKIVFDPKVVTYDQLLHTFWRTVDPTDAGGQFCDRGTSYLTAIFASNDDQKKKAENSKKSIDDSKLLKKPIVTEIRDKVKFYPAEDYHQDYHNKNPLRYSFYRRSCGRDARVKSLWGDEARDGIPQS